MRPVLVALPSKLLFFVALVLAVASFVRDRMRRRRDPKAAASSNAVYLLAGAWALLIFRAGSWIPTAAVFSKPWLPVPIHSYGVMLGTSMIVGWFLAMRLAKQDGIPEEQSGAIYMWTAVWSIVGARILYVLTNWNEFDGHLLDMFKVWNGGLVAYGGMIGGFLASWYGCHKRKIQLLRWADAAAPSVVLGTAITRVGCLLYGCDYGKPTKVPWAIRFPKVPPLGGHPAPAWEDHHLTYNLPDSAPYSLPVHPTQIYELLAGLFLFGLLMYLRRVRKFSGEVFLGWVIGYGILRPVIEIYRDDKQRGSVGPLSTSQFIGMVSVVLAVALMVRLIKRYRQDPEAARLWQRPLEPVAAAAAPARAQQKRRRGAR
jgi:phosphatidylglycerol---prolipoprotein diacylglyceryl transferase